MDIGNIFVYTSSTGSRYFWATLNNRHLRVSLDKNRDLNLSSRTSQHIITGKIVRVVV